MAAARVGYGWRELFDEYDRSGDGSLDMAEFRRALRMEMQITRREISDSEIEKIYEALDVDGNGDISVRSCGGSTCTSASAPRAHKTG